MREMIEYRVSNEVLASLCFLFLLLSRGPADAQVSIQLHTAGSLSDCEGSTLYSARSTNAPAIISSSFGGEGKRLAFRTCRDADGNTHYFIREPRPNRNGVCRVFENEVFPGPSKYGVSVRLLYDGTAPGAYFNMKSWSAWPPDDWTLLHYSRRSSVLGFVTNEDCPIGDDVRYIPLQNVTDGMLKAFQSAWIEATGSPETLDKVFRNVPTLGSEHPGQIDTPPSQKLRDRFRNDIFNGHNTVVEMSCAEDGCSAYLRDQAVGFDFTTSGIVFTKLEQLWIA